MTNRFISILLILLITVSFLGCSNNVQNQETSTQNTYSNENTKASTEDNRIEQTNSDYIIQAEWITFYFSKQDFDINEVPDIAFEANLIMSDIRNFLNVSYTSKEAIESICYFNSSYSDNSAPYRSICNYTEKKIYCVSLDDFVHEYVHLICGNNSSLVYQPNDIFIEGLASYIELNFHENIASTAYKYFQSPPMSKSSNQSEHREICNLLSNKGYTHNEKNYRKAFIALLDKSYDISKIDRDSDFYKYYIGYIFVEHCIENLGGIEKFMSVYEDSVTFYDIYEITVDELILKICNDNTRLFFE